MNRAGRLQRHVPCRARNPFRLQLPPGPSGLWQAAWHLRASLVMSATVCARPLRPDRIRARAVYSPSHAQAKVVERQRAGLNLELNACASASPPSAAALRALE